MRTDTEPLTLNFLQRKINNAIAIYSIYSGTHRFRVSFATPGTTDH